MCATLHYLPGQQKQWTLSSILNSLLTSWLNTKFADFIEQINGRKLFWDPVETDSPETPGPLRLEITVIQNNWYIASLPENLFSKTLSKFIKLCNLVYCSIWHRMVLWAAFPQCKILQQICCHSQKITLVSENSNRYLTTTFSMPWRKRVTWS